MNLIDWIVDLLVLAGATLGAIAAIGIVRLPDLYTRMQSATKAGTLGVACVILAAGIDSREPVVLAEAVLVIVFLFVTSPVASHLIGRAAYSIGVPKWDQTFRDDFADDIATDSSTERSSTDAA